MAAHPKPPPLRHWLHSAPQLAPFPRLLILRRSSSPTAGTILYSGERFRAISKFALVVLRERNPQRQVSTLSFTLAAVAAHLATCLAACLLFSLLWLQQNKVVWLQHNE